MKRLRNVNSTGASQNSEADADPGAMLGADALLALKLGSWQEQSASESPDVLQLLEAPSISKSGTRNVAKTTNPNNSTRTYVWRGPHRDALALKKRQQQFQQPGLGQEVQTQPRVSEGHSSHHSSASGAVASDNEDEVAQQKQKRHQTQRQQQLQHSQQVQHWDDGQGIGEGGRHHDKQWAALTTWLRMNLHHPRTTKKVVLFVGNQDEATGSWNFILNPELTWDDVSIETKLRMKMLPLEAEQAYLQKYPGRPGHEWGSKAQKYKAPGSSATVNILLIDMVMSLNKLYFQHGGCEDGYITRHHNIVTLQQQQQQQHQQLQHQLRLPPYQLQQQQPPLLQSQHPLPQAQLQLQQETLQQLQQVPVLQRTDYQQQVAQQQQQQQQRHAISRFVPSGSGVVILRGSSSMPVALPANQLCNSSGSAAATAPYVQGGAVAAALANGRLAFACPQQPTVYNTFPGNTATGAPALCSAAGSVAQLTAVVPSALCYGTKPGVAMQRLIHDQANGNAKQAGTCSAVAPNGDGTDSCAESVTPVAAGSPLHAP